MTHTSKEREALGSRGAGASASVTVHDRVSFTASVSPEQAAAYVRAKLPRWTEHVVRAWDDAPSLLRFTEPAVAPTARQVEVPARALVDYARRMVELVDALVALGCAQQPSQVLAAMAAIEVGK